MHETSTPSNLDMPDQVYAQLLPQDIEQFYAGYQLWMLQQQLLTLQAKIATLQRDIADNSTHMQQVQPSAIALASLARFQSRGVSDIDLLERMLERGEVWLDKTVQRLDYCEQFDFILHEYTQWCENALEGAFDWIDSISDIIPSETPPTTPAEIAHTPTTTTPTDTHEPLADATEALFLQKLSTEAVDDEPLLEITLKRPAIIPPTPDEPAVLSEAQTEIVEAPPISEELPDTSMTTERIEAEVHATPDLAFGAIPPQEEVFSTLGIPPEMAPTLETSVEAAPPQEEMPETTEKPAPLAEKELPVPSAPVKISEGSPSVAVGSRWHEDWHWQAEKPQRRAGFWEKVVQTVANLLRR